MLGRYGGRPEDDLPRLLEESRLLRELSRVSQGPILVTFLSTHSLSHLGFSVMRRVRGRDPSPAVPPKIIRADAAAAGLAVEEFIPLRIGLSSRTFARLGKPRARR